LKTITTVSVILLFIVICGVAYVQYIRTSIYGWTVQELRARPPTSDIAKEWYHLSWAKEENDTPILPNPIRVIALAEKMADEMNPVSAAVHMASSFYSQVKYLLKLEQVPTAIAFFFESRKWRELALQREAHATETVQPIDIEVLGAPDFMLAKIPVVGQLFKKSALRFLNEAEKRLLKQGQDAPDAMPTAIIYSKMYALTGNKKYLQRISVLELRRDMDENQLLRIANHLGFKTREELYEFCGI
jgi:hypothetical protein